MKGNKKQLSTTTTSDHPSRNENKLQPVSKNKIPNKSLSNFKKWIQEKENSIASEIHRVSPLIKLYWGIAEKHERHLKKKEVLPLGESEHDRQVISDAYKKALTPQELDFDRRAYRALVRMQELRDQSYLLEELDNRYKMELISWELKIRQHPIFILSHVTSMPTVVEEVVEELRASELIVLNQDEHTKEAMNPWEITTPLIILDSHRVAQPVPCIEIDQQKREKLRHQLIKKLKGKTKSLTELSHQLSTLELQILSKILSKNELVALFLPSESKVRFLEPSQIEKLKRQKNLKKCAMVIEASRM